MGCDGGTIPRRDELVRVQKKPEQKDKESELAFRWGHCAINQSPLKMPIVACGLGRLYSKESVLECLLDRSMLPESAKHIKKMRDIKDLVLTHNPDFDKKSIVGGGYVPLCKSPYVCPVIGLEMNGKYKFGFLWNCGCVMSERALKEIKSNLCHKCQQPYEKKDIVILNAEGDDLKVMIENAALRRMSRKTKKNSREPEPGCSSEEMDGGLKKKIKKEEPTVKNGIKNAKIEDPAYKKTTENYSVAKDSKATEVYKSLFTSHRTAEQQTKAHWVTYNPFYN